MHETIIPLLLLSFFFATVGSLIAIAQPRLWTISTLIALASALGAGTFVLCTQTQWHWSSAFLLGDSPVVLQLDALSSFFLLLLSVVAAAGTIYARKYWPDTRYPHSSLQGRLWWNLMISGMVMVLMAANGLHFLLGWELFAISAFFLITLDSHNPQVRHAGWLYLASSHAGTVLLFAFFTSLAVQTGSWELGPVTHLPQLKPLFWLALMGFGIKAGIFPLHIWLPSAHANAPSHVSALLSGVALKIGMYGIVRFSGWLPLPDMAGWVMAGAGCVSAVLGVAFALGQHDLKRLLAYHSVENIGIILMGLGFGIVALDYGLPYWGVLALAGGLLHIWNHGLFKALLFLGAGSVLQATKTRNMSSLGGLWRYMPWTASLFALGSLAICGLPPLNGFVSEWLIYSGLFTATRFALPLSLGAAAIAVLLSITSALALACFIKVCGVVFLGAPRSRQAEHARECDWNMRGAMLVLAGACTTIGLLPTVVWPVLMRVAATWSKSPLPNVPPALTALANAHVLLAFLAVVAAGAMLFFVRKKIHRAPTWDCGYASPTPRMQYTAGSFAGIITAWFAQILRPETYQLRPTTFFPTKAIDKFHTPETVLQYVMEPVGRIFLALGDLATSFQHGRIQSYILYLFTALLVLAAAVVMTQIW